jgi:sterol desaturase/sphingolipid hydroxylase (fatty acid hydroxylase superfamily)
MRAALLVVTPLGLLFTALASVLFAELAGYGLHRLMHSGRLLCLSRAHMIHHLLLYGPRQPMRTTEYKDATSGRASIGNVGLEWLVPSGLILAVCWEGMSLLGVQLVCRCLAMVVLIAWPAFMFSYLHDRMHVRGFWMERVPLLGSWFRSARRFHDIHHHSIDPSGRMNKNFGIGFYFFDRLFRTFAKRHCPFNPHGYRAAMEQLKRDADLTEEYSQFPSHFHF